MDQLVVNAGNMLFNAPKDQSGEPRDARQNRRRNLLLVQSALEAAQLGLLARFRREVNEQVCSSTWEEDCYYRGASYEPDFKCQCVNCREHFSKRRDPRSYRESSISIDCQTEWENDSDLAEELQKLRNVRPKLGSVYLEIR